MEIEKMKLTKIPDIEHVKMEESWFYTVAVFILWLASMFLWGVLIFGVFVPWIMGN